MSLSEQADSAGPGRAKSRQPGRSLAMPDRAVDRAVGQLLAAASRAQQQTAPAHVAASDEGLREQQALSEHVEEWIDVLAGRDAAEQHDARVAAAALAEPLGVAAQRLHERVALEFDLSHRAQI